MLVVMDKSTVGDQIRQLRLAQGLTLREAAPKCGVSFTTLDQLERGVLNTTLDTLAKVGRGLGAEARFDMTIAAALPPERRAIANRFLSVLPHVPQEEIDVFLHELALWERRYRKSM